MDSIAALDTIGLVVAVLAGVVVVAGFVVLWILAKPDGSKHNKKS